MSLSSTYLNVKNLIATNLTSKGVSASKNDGLTTLANAILDIKQGSDQEIVSFDNITTEFNYIRNRGDYGFSVTIPSGVTSLGDGCFRNCTGLTSVTIPSSVTSIGTRCFDSCTNLVDYQLYWETPPITWSSDLMRNNTNTIFTIPQGTTANYTAKDFPSDKLIERSEIVSFDNITTEFNYVRNRGNYGFNVTIPSGVTSLGTDCFFNCAGLTSVTIPSSVTSLRNNCFNGCTGLTSVTIPSSVTSLGGYCFYGCTNLVDYQLYWEDPPINWSSTLMPNNTTTYFTIPNGTTANYVAKSFPNDKLIERST